MKLFRHQNLTLLVIGQIISLFGNAILRFSISLYILDQSGSASVFATILAISILPTIFLSPIGGILADRISRKRIMYILDFLTSLLIFGFSLLFLQGDIPIVIIGVMMILLAIIQACYQPSVSSSVPLLVDKEELSSANGVVVQVNALANLLGPIIGGFLYAIVPFFSLLIIIGSCFFISALIEIILQIPFEKRSREHSFFKTSIQDFKEGMFFILRERPFLLKVLLVLALLNLFMSALISVGMPIICNMILALPSQYYGVLEGGLAIGTILGSILLAIWFKSVQIEKSYQFILYASIAIVFIGLAMVLKEYPYLAYTLTFLGGVFIMIFAAMYNIVAQTFLQKSTPSHLLGKVSAFVTMIVMSSFPIGQFIYGFLFELLFDQSQYIFFFASAFSIIICFLSKYYAKKL